MEEAIIREIIGKVNTTLSYFDSGYISARRTDSRKDRCYEFSEYVECRFNYELGKLDEFKDLFLEFEGCIFKCTLDTPNLVKRNFKLATLRIEIDKTQLESNEILKNEVTRFIEWFGGNKISFTHKKKKFTYKIEYEEDDIS